MSKKTFAICLIIMTIAILAGCGETTNFLTGEPEVQRPTRTSNEIHIPIDKIRTLNPIISKDEDAYYINKLVYEGLFGFDENLTLVGVLAKGYDYENGKATVRIKLKQGIKWQDGEDFTAEDVKFSIESHIKAATAGLSMYTNNVSNIKNVNLVQGDPYQVIINFINTDKVSMSDFIFPMIPQHQFKNIDMILQQYQDFICVGTGPYKVTKYNKLENIQLEGNDSYHNGKPPGNILHFQSMPDKLDAVNLMEVSDIVLTFSKEIDRDTIFAHKNVNMVSFPSNEVELVGFNHRTVVDKRIRQAIAYAIDTNLILESGYYKNGLLNDNPYYPNYLGVDSKEMIYKFDLEKASQRLAEAGYIDRNGNGFVENGVGEELAINILVNSEDAPRMAAAQTIKNGLDKLFVKSTITVKDWEGFNSDLASGSFDLFVGGFQMNETYELRPFLHTNHANVIGYSNPSLDVLLDQMASGLTNEEKKNTFVEIKEILTDDLPYFCLLYKTYGAIASPALEGELKPLFNNIYNGSESWSSVFEIKEDKEQ